MQTKYFFVIVFLRSRFINLSASSNKRLQAVASSDNGKDRDVKIGFNSNKYYEL